MNVVHESEARDGAALHIENIGKIREADIALNGITVIAGENDTGKSTVGKALYCVVNGYCRVDERVYEERLDSLERWFSDMEFQAIRPLKRSLLPVTDICQALLSCYKESEFTRSACKDIVYSYIQSNVEEAEAVKNRLWNDMSSSKFDLYWDKIFQVLKSSDEEVLKSIVEKIVLSEFSGQPLPVSDKSAIGSVKLTLGGHLYNISINDNEVAPLVMPDKSMNADAVLIDNPFVLDELPIPSRYRSISDKQHHHGAVIDLLSKPSVSTALNEALTKKQLESVLKMLNDVSPGELVGKKGTTVYHQAGMDDIVVQLLSTGLKSFVILKTLLIKEKISPQGYIILDEPEIHLHPDWQLKFAELIVLLHRELDVKVLLTSHSPYFIRAIEVYAAKHGVADRCSYYLAETDGKSGVMSDVTANRDEIYKKLAYAFQTLNDEEFVLNEQG
jgi:predicted ATPase